jgi:hypothetical protein
MASRASPITRTSAGSRHRIRAAHDPVGEHQTWNLRNPPSKFAVSLPKETSKASEFKCLRFIREISF